MYHFSNDITPKAMPVQMCIFHLFFNRNCIAWVDEACNKKIREPWNVESRKCWLEERDLINNHPWNEMCRRRINIRKHCFSRKQFPVTDGVSKFEFYNITARAAWNLVQNILFPLRRTEANAKINMILL